MNSTQDIQTPLKDAIRAFWYAASQLRQAQREELRVISFYQTQVVACKQHVRDCQEKTKTLVLTGEDGCSYDDEKINREILEMLLAQGIVAECLYCEEQDDLASCYDGDHREFHLAGDHHEYCIEKALHVYDPHRWPVLQGPYDGAIGYDCQECGIVAP